MTKFKSRTNFLFHMSGLNKKYTMQSFERYSISHARKHKRIAWNKSHEIESFHIICYHKNAPNNGNKKKQYVFMT